MTDVEKAIPEVEVTFDGKPFKLVFTCEAMARVELLTGKNCLNGEVWQKLNVTTLSAILFALLSQSDPALSLVDVRSKLSVTGLGEYLRAINQALINASPPEKKTAEQPPAATPNP